MDEKVDIVDKKDRVIRSTSKQNAHKKGFLHRTVIAEVIDSKGRFILTKQASDRQDAGQYVSPVGGHVQSDETQDEALKREAFEELGLTDFEYEFIGKAIFNRDILGRHENHYFILYEIKSDGKITLNHESIDFKTFTKKQLKETLKKHPEQFGAAYMFILKTFYPEFLS